MKRSIGFLVAAALIFSLATALAARAQIPPPPTPTPDPHSYSDPGMNYTAPADAVLVGRQQMDLKALSNDLQPVANWLIHPGKEDARVISIAMESFEGPPNQWEAQFESQTHSSNDGVLIKDKTPMALLNGMPATFVEVTYGTGFDAKKEYAIVLADGQRGIVLSLTARLGDVTEAEAKTVLHEATATQYPTDEP